MVYLIYLSQNNVNIQKSSDYATLSQIINIGYNPSENTHTSLKPLATSSSFSVRIERTEQGSLNW